MCIKLQVKAFLRGESPPYSAGDLEGMTFIASMHVKVARRLHSNSLRYWLLEYLRRQPKGRKYKALILKFIKDRMAALLLVEVSQHTSSNKVLFDGAVCAQQCYFYFCRDHEQEV